MRSTVIEQVGADSCLIADETLRSVLIGEPQVTTAPASLVPVFELDELKKTLEQARPHEIIDAVSDFAFKFGGKKRPPHIRARFDALTKTFPAPTYYLAAVRLLVSWRNRHVHQSKDKVTQDDESELVRNSTLFWDEHSNTDISMTLTRYHERNGPSLKDISTLISVLQRTIRTIDEAIIDACNIDEVARQALQQTFNRLGPAEDRLKQLWGLSTEIRRRKLTVYLKDFGFQPKTEKARSGRQLPTEFLDNLLRLDRFDAAAYLKI